VNTDLVAVGEAQAAPDGIPAVAGSAPAGPPRQRRHLLHGPVAQTLHVVLLLIAAAGDAMNFDTALGVLAQNQTDLEVWTVVAALTAAAVGSMHFVGTSARRVQGARPGPRQGAAIVALTTFWLALGVSAFLLRLQLPDADADLPPSASFGASPAATTEGVSSDSTTLFFAVLMLCLYLTTGAMAAWGAFHLPAYDPSRAQERRSRRHHRRARFQEHRVRARGRRHARSALKRARRNHRRAWSELGAADSRWEQLQAEMQLLEKDAERNGERIAAATAASSAGAMELKEYVRVLMSAAMGDPASTNALTGPPELETGSGRLGHVVEGAGPAPQPVRRGGR
jgi:hypothetical protein